MKHLKPQVAHESTEPAPAGPQPVLVELTATAVSVNGTTIAWTELHQRVKERLAESHQTAVFLKIADDVEYAEAIRLLDVCKGAGAQILALPPGSRG